MEGTCDSAVTGSTGLDEDLKRVDNELAALGWQRLINAAVKTIAGIGASPL